MNTFTALTAVINPVVSQGNMLDGVLNEVIALIPTCIPIMVTFIGIRKGLAFIQSVLHSA